MKRNFAPRILLLTTLGLSGLAMAQKPAPGDGPGWTGITNPKAIITAREELMVAVESLMEPIDSLDAEAPKDLPKDLKLINYNADKIAKILLSLPHLFPPTTNLYDPKAAQPETLALPAIWQSWDNFYQLAGASAAAAKNLSETWGATPEQLDEAGDAIRATCDACHALYLRPFVPSKVSEQDLNFDFDSVLKKN